MLKNYLSIAGMVDEEDPLEMARQGTVHLWENEGHNDIIICHGMSDDHFFRNVTSSPVATASGASDDAVLYHD